MGKATIELRRAEKARKQAQAEERRKVVLRVLSEADALIDDTIARLRAAGTEPSCTRGCVYCCYLEIRIPRAEAENMAAWIEANRAPAEVEALRDRLRAWLAWYRTDVPRLIAGGTARGEAFLAHGPGCALLEDGACSAYPVRPLPCRNHYVSSPPEACSPAAGPGSTVQALAGIPAATRHLGEDIRRTVELQGGSFEASMHLLPEWLAHLLGVEAEPWTH